MSACLQAIRPSGMAIKTDPQTDRYKLQNTKGTAFLDCLGLDKKGKAKANAVPVPVSDLLAYVERLRDRYAMKIAGGEHGPQVR